MKHIDVGIEVKTAEGGANNLKESILSNMDSNLNGIFEAHAMIVLFAIREVYRDLVLKDLFDEDYLSKKELADFAVEIAKKLAGSKFRLAVMESLGYSGEAAHSSSVKPE